MRTPRQRVAWDAYLRSKVKVVFTVDCDGGCGQVYEGTHDDRRRAGWATRWWRTLGTGVQLQVDLCPACQRGTDGPAPRQGDETCHSLP